MKVNNNQHLFIIIQARMGSTRLPGKVMLPLCGKTVLEVMLDRLGSFKKQIIIATTNDGSEQPIINLCKRSKINYFQGDTNNVLSRYHDAALHYGARENDLIVRLTSDCPVHDQEIILKVINAFQKKKCDFMSNTIHRKYPRGLDTAIFTFKLLKEAHHKATSAFDKEHVTAYFHSSGDFEIASFEPEDDNSKYRLTLDEEEDYRVIKEIYKLFSCKVNFTYNELISLLNKNPYIAEMNAHIEQKKC